MIWNETTIDKLSNGKYHFVIKRYERDEYGTELIGRHTSPSEFDTENEAINASYLYKDTEYGQLND